MTAAHCVWGVYSCGPQYDSGYSPVVRIGALKRSDGPLLYEVRNTVETLRHPQFRCGFNTPPKTTPNMMNNDVALLKLDVPSTMPTVALIGSKPKPEWNNPVPTNSSARVVGWGLDATNNLADTLQQMAVRVADLQAVCQKAWGAAEWASDQCATCPNNNVSNSFNNNTMMCTTAIAKSGFCSGDSGGPLIVDGGSAAADQQIGIVSWGSATCGDGDPDVYTDVGTVYKWVQAAVNELTGQPFSGTVSGEPAVIRGFDTVARRVAGTTGNRFDLLVYSGLYSLSAVLGTSPTGRAVLSQVQWQWGDLAVGATLNIASRNLVVRLAGAPVAANTNRTIPNGSLSYAAKDKVARLLTIVQTGVTVVVSHRYAGGAWQPFLGVTVTYTLPPPGALYGQLGDTLPSATGK